MVQQTDPQNTRILQHYKTLEARFDRAAKLYDATYGPPDDNGHGNPLMGWLRSEHLAILRDIFPPKAVLLDIGCGTGEESLALARDGYAVLGIDISPAMVRQAQIKMAVNGIQRGVSFRTLPAGRLSQLDERGPFHGAFASLGTLNTEPDLPGVAAGLHTLLEPGAAFVATVMSRRCLFDALDGWFGLRASDAPNRGADWAEGRAGTGGVVAPVKYYTPDEFAAAFAPHFSVEAVMAFPLWLPPVHLHERYRQHPRRYARRVGLERRMREWAGFRAWGDHFLMVLRHTSSPDRSGQGSHTPAEHRRSPVIDPDEPGV